MTDELYLPEGEAPYDGPMAIMRTFVLHSKVKVLSGLADLSYIAGRDGDDEWAWAIEADDALIDAFHRDHETVLHSGKTRFDRLNRAKLMLADAFRGGRAQREIDLGVAGKTGPETGIYCSRQIGAVAVCDRAMSLARAHATIYADEIEFPDDGHPENIRREIGYVATKVAQRLPVTDAEAAYCALRAFEERGLKTSLEAAAWALDRAASGRADREAEEERARERAAEVSNATAGLFGGGE